mgnify:FL=1
MDFPRKLALEALYKIDKKEAYSNIVLDELLNKNRNVLSNKDINFISELVYGVTTWKLTLDTIIQKYSKIKIKKISPWVINILRMGAYQIVFLDKVPKSAAVNESVNLCKKYGGKSIGFVNAILRKVEKSDYLELFEIKNDIEKISKTTSMPEWIVKELNKEFNTEKVNEICKNSNLKPKITIRVNNLKTTKNELRKSLQSKEIEVEDVIIEDFLYLKNVKNITNLDEYKKGLFTMQDESAGLTALVLNPKEGESILDCCSAPGGKTTYIAELMNNNGNVMAWDLYKHRLDKVQENSKRLGIDIIKTEENDATVLKEEYIEKFDKILIDAPCLGLGVIKRKPDIKWQRKFEDVEEISKIQEKILNTCSKYLKKGGILVYSTCSIIQSENEKIVEKFLKSESFELEEINNVNIENLENKITKKGIIKLYPSENMDGFFISKLIKK